MGLIPSLGSYVLLQEKEKKCPLTLFEAEEWLVQGFNEGQQK